MSYSIVKYLSKADVAHVFPYLHFNMLPSDFFKKNIDSIKFAMHKNSEAMMIGDYYCDLLLYLITSDVLLILTTLTYILLH